MNLDDIKVDDPKWCFHVSRMKIWKDYPNGVKKSHDGPHYRVVIWDQFGLDVGDERQFVENNPWGFLLLKANQLYLGSDWENDEDSEDGLGKWLGWCYCLNMNDTFYYACGDGEKVERDEMEELIRIYEEWGSIGLTCWAAKKRGYDPCIEYTEDQVYIDTWRGLYGDLSVKQNPMLEDRPDYRWSNDKLNLKVWKKIK